MSQRGRPASYSTRQVSGKFKKELVQEVLYMVENPAGETQMGIRKPRSMEEKYTSYAERYQREGVMRMQGEEDYEGKIISERVVRNRKKRAKALREKEEKKKKEQERGKQLESRILSEEQEKFFIENYWVELTPEQARERGINIKTVSYWRNLNKYMKENPDTLELKQGKERYTWRAIKKEPDSQSIQVQEQKVPRMKSLAERLAERKSRMERVVVKKEDLVEIKKEKKEKRKPRSTEDMRRETEEVERLYNELLEDEALMELVNNMVMP